jgi:hypothetical protein
MFRAPQVNFYVEDIEAALAGGVSLDGCGR